MNCVYCGFTHSKNNVCHQMRQVMDDARAGSLRPSESTDEPRGPGAIDLRDRFGMCAAPQLQSGKHGEGPTPRTDAVVWRTLTGSVGDEVVHSSFARQLERELAEAIERATSMERAAVAYQEQFASSLPSATAPQWAAVVKQQAHFLKGYAGPGGANLPQVLKSAEKIIAAINGGAAPASTSESGAVGGGSDG